LTVGYTIFSKGARAWANANNFLESIIRKTNRGKKLITGQEIGGQGNS
jgi:hypothetical protein